ncbi:MAG TPA: hypothetical protein VGT99_11600, partial [Gammaproteobacteria bacterium]|nr:hypothetical protein [Gammaproteobacteria bacterium]
GGAVTFNTSGAGGSVDLKNSGGTNLGASTIGGNLGVTDTTGAISQSGVLTVAGTSSFSAAGANAVTLNNAGNDFTGAVTVANAGNVTLDEKNNLTLAGITATGVVQINFGQAGAGSTLNLGAGAITGSSVALAGGAGNDTLIGQPGSHTWTVNGVDSGQIDSPTFTFSSIENLVSGSGTNTYDLNGGYVNSIAGNAGDTINVTAAVNAAGQTLSYTAGTIRSSGAADVLTASNLTLGGASLINLDTAVTTLAITGSSGTATINNTGALALGNIAMGAGNFTLTASGNISGGTVTAGNATLNATAGSIGSAGSNLALNLSGTLTANASGSIWATDAGALAVSNITSGAGATSINLTANSMTSSAATLSSGTGGSNLATAGAMTLDDVTATNGLTLANGGTLTVNNSAGGGTPGLQLNGGSLSQTGAGGVVLNGNVQTSGGSISFNSGVTVNGAINLASANGAESFAGAITGNGGASLTLNSGSGNIQLAAVNMDAASGTLALASTGTVTLDASVSAQSVNLTGVTGNLAIGGDLSITTSGTSLDLSKIAGGVNDTVAGTHSLAINTGAGNVSLASNIGTVQALRSFNVNAAQMILGNVDTTGGQSYTGSAQLNATLANNGGGDIVFQGGNVTLGQNSTVNDTGGNISIAGAVDGARSLTMNAGGSVTLASAVGANTALSALSITGKTINVDAVVDTSGTQTYAGALSLKGNLTSTAGALDFTNTLKLLSPVTLTANTMAFGGAGTVSGTSTLTILPETSGYTMDFGSGGASAGQLMLEADAFNGYQGVLYIGAVPSATLPGSIAKLPTAGNILVDGSTSLGSTGELVLASAGNITLQSGIIGANTVILAAKGSLLSSPSGGSPATVEGNTIYTIANQIGGNGSGQAINVSGLPGSGPATLNIGSVQNSVFFTEAPGTSEIKAPDLLANDIANVLGLSLNGNVTVTNSGLQTAANQQTGGLLTSGFIDVSVFQQISLYDVNGTGIALPADQCEEEQSGNGSTTCGGGGQ